MQRSHEGWAQAVSRTVPGSMARVALEILELVERRGHFRASPGDLVLPGPLRDLRFYPPSQGLGQAQPPCPELNKSANKAIMMWFLLKFKGFFPSLFPPCPHKSCAGTRRWQWLSPALLYAYHRNNKWIRAPWPKFPGRSCAGQKPLVLRSNAAPFSEVGKQPHFCQVKEEKLIHRIWRNAFSVDISYPPLLLLP